MVQGISMSVTQRDEFAAVIRQTGGKVGGLIKALRRKTASN
jgi:ABC-type transporter MlaC component